MRDQIYKIDNFVIELDRDEADINKESIVIRDIASSWSIAFSNNNIMFTYWSEAVHNAKEKLSYRKALEATVTDLYILSTIGIHDPGITNDICDAVLAFNKRLKDAITEVEERFTEEEKAEEADDNEEWLDRQECMDKMYIGVKKEEESK